MRVKPWLLCGAVAAATSVASTARAADWLTMLEWACRGDDASNATVKALALKACDATEGTKTACDVVAGTPYACFDKKSVKKESVSCDYASLRFQITAATSQTFGWKIEGKLTVIASYDLFWQTVNECELTAKVPVPTDKGGDYIFKAGTAGGVAWMTASGTGAITFLGGTVFSETETKVCSRRITVSGYKQANASSCSGQATPTPTPVASPTPIASATPVGTPPPMPSPGSSPTPVPTVSATPPPPTPVASATPDPTPFATPNPTPFATPTSSTPSARAR